MDERAFDMEAAGGPDEEASGIRRRAWLLSPGEPLILGSSPLEAAVRFGEVIEALRVDANDVDVSQLCALPVPAQSAEPRLLAKTCDPAIAWNPLVWLPSRLTALSGEPLARDIHALRVCLELTASGLYDPMSGTWTDVLDLVGIDIDDASGLDRVVQWQAGRADPALDAVDLTAAMADTDYPDWSLESAYAMAPTLTQCSIALGMDALLSMSDDVLASFDTSDQATLVESLETIRDLAQVWSAPDDRHPDWDSIAQLAGQDADNDDVRSSLLALVDAIAEVRERYWPTLEAHMGAMTAPSIGSVDGIGGEG
jgi:hypothetical protein